MTEKDGWPTKWEILPNPFKAIGHFIKEACSLHLLSPVSDHFQPFEEAPQPVTHIHGENNGTTQTS